MNRVQIYIASFLCYTSIHALRTSYSYTKRDIQSVLEVNQTYLGIVDALMLTFLGIGHFTHTAYPIKKPVKTLWIAMILCGINYSLIPICMNIPQLKSIITLAILMCINGYLQSYTWPNLLMIIQSKFIPEQYPVLLGFWATNANIGNIIGYGIFQVFIKFDFYSWGLGLFICAVYSVVNGVYIFFRFQQLGIEDGNRSLPVYYYEDQAPQMIKNINEEYSPIQNNKQTPQNLQKFQKQQKLQKQNISQPEQQQPQKDQNTIQKQLDQNKDKQNENDPLKPVIPSIRNVLNDPKIILLTLTFALAKSVIYGMMLWLPLYFKLKQGLSIYAALIPISYDVAAIFGSVIIGYFFNRIQNKGLLMIPFMFLVFLCFFLLKFVQGEPVEYFLMIGTVGFALGGIFNTLSSLVILQLITVIPQAHKRQSLGFYSALTMAIGNFTTALTQILIGVVIGQDNHESIFMIFMIYAGTCLICLVILSLISCKKEKENQSIKDINYSVENRGE